MRSILLFILILFLSFGVGASDLFLDDADNGNARNLGMGGAGISLDPSFSSSYSNPAQFAGDILISLPYSSLTFYNVRSNIDNGMLSRLIKGDWEEALTIYATGLPSSYTPLLRLDSGINLGFKQLALGLHLSSTAFSYGEGSFQNRIGLDSRVGLSLTLSERLAITESFSIDLGYTFNARYRVMMADDGDPYGLMVEDVLALFKGELEPEVLLSLPVVSGFEFPMDVGMRINLPYGFSLGAVYRDMMKYEDLYSSSRLDEALKKDLGIGVKEGRVASAGFSAFSSAHLDLGLSYSMTNGSSWIVRPTLAFDLVDVIGLFSVDDPLSPGSWVHHLRLGAELRFLSSLSLRAGLDRGFISVGFGVDLALFRVDVAYSHDPIGNSNFARDYLMISANLGFDR